MGYLDCHIHLVGTNNRTHQCYVSDRLKKSLLFKFAPLYLGIKGIQEIDNQGDDLTLDTLFADKLVELIDSSQNLDGGVLLAMDGVYDINGKIDWQRTDLYVSNQYLYKVCNRHPGLYPGPSINPARRDWQPELETAAEKGALLVKLLPNSMDIDLSKKQFSPFFRQMAKLNLPLLSHTGFEHSICPINQKYGDPARLRRALDEGVTVIAAHCGTSGFGHLKEYFPFFVKMLAAYPNLYGDISAFNSLSRTLYLKKLVNSKIANRLIYGSDFPVPVFAEACLARLPLKEIIKLRKITNYFDRDVAIKKAMGVEEQVFQRSAEMLLQ